MDFLNAHSLSKLTNAEILKLRSLLRIEISRRGIANSVGSVGEQLVIEHFRSTPGLTNLQVAPRGTKNVDALSRDGERYSIKTICDAKKTGTIYPDSTDPDKQLFEFLLVVILTADWEARSIHQFSWDAFLQVRSWDKRMNAWYISLSRKNLNIATEILKNE